MITIASANGRFLRSIADLSESVTYGFHRQFGLVSEETAEQRLKNRKKFGLDQRDEWLCRFRLMPGSGGRVDIVAEENCRVTARGNTWWIESPTLSFQLTYKDSEFTPLETSTSQRESRDRIIPSVTLSLLALFLIGLLFPWKGEEIAEEEKKEPVIVKIVKPKRSVTVPMPKALKNLKRVAKNQKQENKVRRAVKQNLGFLGILGEEKLRKALGGTPSKLKDVSPGAGAGGKEGSGGELLVGLGKGVRKTTVGNTGTVGLGGVGTKGKGGGQGGYGNAAVSSGVGGSLTDIPLADDVVMEGGLSQSVIQATIAKYLSQVRACYEMGLRKKPGLAGTVATRFEIGANGRLNYSKVARSTLGNSQVEDCIVRNMQRWQFPRPEGGVKVKVSYPFLLRPVRL